MSLTHWARHIIIRWMRAVFCDVMIVTATDYNETRQFNDDETDEQLERRM